MKRINFIVAIVTMSVVTVFSASCNAYEARVDSSRACPESSSYEEYNVINPMKSNLPYAEYSLNGTSCEWNFPEDFNEIIDAIIVNSDEELSNYVKSNNNASYPNIDFTKHTLIITHGCAASGIECMHLTDFTKHSDLHYEILIEIEQTLVCVMSPWVYAFVVDKISDDAQIGLGIILK